jgi:hypothetical protein
MYLIGETPFLIGHFVLSKTMKKKRKIPYEDTYKGASPQATPYAVPVPESGN